MTTYRMDDETIVSPEKATRSWEEDTRWDGNNHISVAAGSQWNHETLHASAKGRYWIESSSQWQGSLPSARFVEPREAAAWLILNGHELPEDLKAMEAEILE